MNILNTDVLPCADTCIVQQRWFHIVTKSLQNLAGLKLFMVLMELIQTLAKHNYTSLMKQRSLSD